MAEEVNNSIETLRLVILCAPPYATAEKALQAIDAMIREAFGGGEVYIDYSEIVGDNPTQTDESFILDGPGGV